MVDRVAAMSARDPRERRREAPQRGAAQDAGRKRAQAGGAAAATCTGRRWGSSRSPAQRTVDSDLPEGDPPRRGRATTDDDGRRSEHARRDRHRRPAHRGRSARCWTSTTSPSCCARNQLLRGVKRPFAHLFVDEAQDLSPMKLAVLIGARRTRRKRVDHAGRATRRSGCSSTTASATGAACSRTWRSRPRRRRAAAHRLPLDARDPGGRARTRWARWPTPTPPEAPRTGAPVEAFRFPGVGAAVAFLAEALRELAAREPRATVALLARHPEQADRYFDGLRRAEVPALRRMRAQEFSVPPRRRGDRRPPGQGARVRLRRDARRQRQQLRPRRRVAPPVPHRRDARRAPALAGGDRRADAARAAAETI